MSVYIRCERTSYFHPISTPRTQPVPQHRQPDRRIDTHTTRFAEDAALEALPAEVADWMQIKFGQAALAESTPDDTFTILNGGGANGKSTIVLAVKKPLETLGDYFKTHCSWVSTIEKEDTKAPSFSVCATESSKSYPTASGCMYPT